MLSPYATRTSLGFVLLLPYLLRCGVEQLVARLAHNQKVAGSSPASAPRMAIHKRKRFSCLSA